MQRVDFILQRLEGVVALFLGARAGIAFRIRDLPLFGDFTVLLKLSVTNGASTSSMRLMVVPP
jgi:hypothetical protein